jgi:putative tricarboxylic transport membrane protein
MEAFSMLGHGMLVALQPMNLLFALIGVFLGTAVGVLPGIGPALTVALLLPVTYKLDPGGSLIMFAGICEKIAKPAITGCPPSRA